MSRTEVLTQVNTRFLSEFWARVCISRPPGEPLLLPEARERRKGALTFDPALEQEYLERLSFGKKDKLGELEREISTALQEECLVKFSQTYFLAKGRLVDVKTGLSLVDLTAKGGMESESLAMRKVEGELLKEDPKLIVQISPKDDEVSYPDNMVSFWLKDKKGTVHWLRFKIKGDWGEMKALYWKLGGQARLESQAGLRAEPVMTELKLGDVLLMLNLEEAVGVVKNEEIETIVVRAVKELGGGELSSEEILRVYLAAKREVGRLTKIRQRFAVRRAEVDLSQFMIEAPWELYRKGKIELSRQQGGGCGSVSLGGEFATRGWILEDKGGKIVAHFGSTEGLKFCAKCNCWYSGSKCPFCEK